ncbi:IclR family transcriptional regulator [Deinococcus ruber]|uniref:IclR family transcriptional regulator n=1 Tax=Deinococcus ruber TaxID=1848197 RepID=A0A918C826_9DEIO|nr:IclR family transcriptional regulator [Deinococcus ruber]GGR10570.1 IclR family transcriptional regulator [Deinococcus ruber]
MSPVLDVPRYLIQSAATTLEVLLTFGKAPYRFTPSEVAQHLQIERNQAFRCLRTLQHVGFVRQDEDERFVLTSLVEQLASASQGQPSLAKAAKVVMDELSQSTDETVNLFALEGLEALCVDFREGLRQVRLVTSPAERRSLHAGACPKAMLAYLPPAQQNEVLQSLPELPAYTPYTLLDAQKLQSDLESIRLRGYAISDLDVDEEARGVGAAIFGAQGQVVGAVSVGGPASRMTPARIEALGQQIVEAARLISRQLGFNG